jgi:hypothetical protein
VLLPPRSSARAATNPARHDTWSTTGAVAPRGLRRPTACCGRTGAAERRLELADLRGQRGLRRVKHVRRAREAAQAERWSRTHGAAGA